MTIFRIVEEGGNYVDIEADNFEASPAGLILTKKVESLNPLDPIEKLAFCGLFKNFFAFYAVDDDGNRINLIR